MSAHGLGMDNTAHDRVAVTSPALAALNRSLEAVNAVIMLLASLALIAAGAILSYSVLVRHLFRVPTYWQDEASVFLLVGGTFLTAAHVQSLRGHVAIEALVGLLPRAVNRVRLLMVDLVTLGFCAFFAWKSWTLLHEAWVDGQVTSSTWGPPLWIPYSAMASGMTLLSVQVLAQVLVQLSGKRA